MYIPQQSFIFINHEDEAHQYIVPSNTTTLLMCRQKPIFFIKSADSLGQYTMDRYSFKKEPLQPQQNLPENIVTTDQFKQFKDEILAILAAQKTPKEDTPLE